MKTKKNPSKNQTNKQTDLRKYFGNALDCPFSHF